jgi:PHS family inorganic phosphate transporter-like MFS transporter
LISESNDSLKLAGKRGTSSPRNWGALVSGLITATGNFNVQYNFGAIAIALIVMSSVECTSATAEDCRQGHQASWVNGTASATVFAGAIFGQLTMGYAGDIVGRNIAMTLTLSIAALGALLSALLPSGSPQSVYITIIVCRFILGIGLGGIYPLAATKAAEDSAAAKALIVLQAKADAITDAAANPPSSPAKAQAQANNGGSMSISLSNANNPNGGGRGGADASLDENAVDVSSAAWAFFWQAPGAMTPWLIALLMTYGSSNMPMDTRWRLLLGLGTIPASIAVILSFVEARLNARQMEDLMAKIEEAEEAEMDMANAEEDKYLGALTSAMDIENTFMGKESSAGTGNSPSSIPLVQSGGNVTNDNATGAAAAGTTLGLNPKPAHTLRNRNRTGSGFGRFVLHCNALRPARKIIHHHYHVLVVSAVFTW